MSLYSQAVAVSRQRETKQEIIAYFKKEYPGVLSTRGGTKVEDWRSKLASAIQPFVGDKRESVLRQFQGKRATSTSVTPKWRQAYEDLGALLPPIPPENGYHISGEIHVKYSETCEPREVDIDIVGEEAEQFLASAMQALINVYNGQKIDEEEPSAEPCAQGEWALTVEANE